MKRVFTGSFVAVAFVASLSAQTTPPQSQPTQEPQQAKITAKDAAKSVTVTGCLKAGEGIDTFLLSNLKWSQDKAVGTSGAVVSSTPAITATALKLVGDPGTKLSDHVGHTVEVTGTIAEKADKAPSPGEPAPAARPAPGGPQASLNVRDVKMIAATCPAQ